MSKNFREAFKQICSMYTCCARRHMRLRADSASRDNGGALYMRNAYELGKSGSEPRSSLLIYNKKASMSSLNRNGTSVRDLQNI